jgi:hypothetical protein
VCVCVCKLQEHSDITKSAYSFRVDGSKKLITLTRSVKFYVVANRKCTYKFGMKHFSYAHYDGENVLVYVG